MAPKIEAACRFIEATGGIAAIGVLADAPALLRGDRGTRITVASLTASKMPARAEEKIARPRAPRLIA